MHLEDAGLEAVHPSVASRGQAGHAGSDDDYRFIRRI